MVAQTTPAAPAAGKIVGIIYPPPEVRTIVDKTAKFVARGAEYLTRMREDKANDPKFSFLKEGDPYHAYFLMRVSEGPQDGEKPAGDAQVKPAAAVAAAPVQETKPLESPPEFHYSTTVPTISAQDIDTVKLTAQFVAQNGKQFEAALMQKEDRNHHFDFLKPQRPLNLYYTKLVEQYTRVLAPQKGVKEELARAANDKFYAYSRIQHRVQWVMMEREKMQREADAREKERLEELQIDWHDFTVVETIPNTEFERLDLPPPVNAKTLMARVIEQERYNAMKDKGPQMAPEEKALLAEAAAAAKREAAGESEGEDVDMEVEDVDMDMGSPEPMAAPFEPIQPGQVIVRKDYDPKQKHKEKGGGMYQNCPNCGQSILASELAEHIRIELLDPRWREQKERLERERAAGQTVYSSVDAMEKTLKHIANYRTDIFNTDEGEAAKKVAEDKKAADTRVTWDGHSGSANIVQKKAQDNIRPEDLKVPPRPDPIGPRGPTPGQRQQMQQQQQQYPVGGAPQFMQQFPPGMGPPGMYNQMGMPMPGMMAPPGMGPPRGFMPPPPPPGGPPPQQPQDGNQPKRPRIDGQLL